MTFLRISLPRVVLASLVLFLVLVLGWTAAIKWPHLSRGLLTPLLTTPDDITKYQGHRLLVWVFDSKTHQVRGFADAMVRPGESVRLEPTAGVGYDLNSGGMTRQQIYERGRLVSEYDGVDYELRCGTHGEESIMSLIWPSCYARHHIARGLDVIDFKIPVGPEALKPLAERIPPRFRGTAEELEDLVLACLPRWRMHFSQSLLISIYEDVGPTQRAGQWLELLRSDDSDLQIRAAAVLTLAGNREATEIFCQTARPDVLAEMPPSKPVLDRMASLVLQEGPLVHYDTGLGLSCPDMRYYLIGAITKKYTREDLRPYAAQLLRWAMDRDEPWAEDLRKFLKQETDSSRPGPDT